jgi:hypothetical protein
MTEFDEIARQLHATRAEPDPEFARELDRRAAEWLREARRRLPSLRIAIPAVGAATAAAAVAVALVVSGGEEERTPALEVAVVGDQGAAEALGAPLDLERRAAPKLEGGLAPPAAARVDAGEPVRIRYFITARAKGTVRLAGREAPLDIASGSGRLEISTEGLPPGTHRLEITLPPLPPYGERIDIGG